MRKRLFRWEAAGFLWVSAAGTLLHFLYEWTGDKALAAVVSGVNESTWEHMKLLFIPLFVFSVVQICVMGKSFPNILAVRAISALIGLALIPILYYTYTGVTGRSVSWANIAIFYVAALTSFLVDGALLRRGRFSSPWQQLLGLLVLWALLFAFVWCTFRPFPLPLWQDPVTGRFGI